MQLTARLDDLLADLDRRLAETPLVPALSRGALRTELARYDFARPRALPGLVAEVADLLVTGNLHAVRSRYLGLFTPAVTSASVAGDLLAAVTNAQLGAWWHAPAACEIEAHTLAWLRERVGFSARGAFTGFTSGGSESNHTATLAALARAFPRAGAAGLAALRGRPTLYASTQAHDSFVKIAHAVGLGRTALRRVRADADGRIDVADLARRVARDRRSGRAPFLVVATAGTTALGAIDPLAALADYCAAEGLWLHVDAAWGGIALLSDRLRPVLAGIERAHSVSWDAHKTMPVPVGAGMIFLRGPDGARAAEAAFDVSTDYVPDSARGTVDSYRRSLQWSRRFIGLKVFLVLAEHGAAGMARLVDHQAEMGDVLRAALCAHGWRVVNDSRLPLVCFTHPALVPAARAVPRVLARVLAEGAAWISQVRVGGAHYLRACITNHRSQREDIDALVGALARAVAR